MDYKINTWSRVRFTHNLYLLIFYVFTFLLILLLLILHQILFLIILIIILLLFHLLSLHNNILIEYLLRLRVLNSSHPIIHHRLMFNQQFWRNQLIQNPVFIRLFQFIDGCLKSVLLQNTQGLQDEWNHGFQIVKAF